ncbi:hypothetical protein HOF65_06275 [bacterium]|nr:hypothetical protein [bacterium]MBT3853534.1 hypothetical protein [bacterium]MBT4632751.1 hypothetical protein [bacterium]MBT5491230.1 hypothetical protein [bacterium]MBT6779280.1 hypothetical protein [bacterium]
MLIFINILINYKITMNQVVKDKMKREIMVVSNKAIFGDMNKETKFYLNSEVNFEKNILENYEYMIR